MSNSKQTIALLSLSMLLSACGGGGDDKSAGGAPAPNQSAAEIDAQIVANLKSSNIDFVPGANGRPAGTWRWPGTPERHISVYIPPPTPGNATEADYAAKAAASVAQINTKLSGLLVLDAVASAPASGNYIRVGYGTSYVPSGSADWNSYCANVATGPNIGSMVMPDAANGIYSNPVFINLGNGHCSVTQEIVTHEFGHALGLANHYQGFGQGPETQSSFWDVLATLYGNPPSTPATNLVVKHARN